LLLSVYRKIVFVHDTYIFAAIVSYAVLRRILYLSTTQIREGESWKYFEELPSYVRDGVLARLLEESMFKKIGLKREDLAFVEEFVASFKLYPIFEYALRVIPREVLVELASKNLVWLIPFTSITSTAVKRVSGIDVFEIAYSCPLLNRTRLFRVHYNPEFAELIRELCRFNGNDRCKGG